VKGSVLVGVGVVLVFFGVIWTLQGLGRIGGSAMSGVTLWAVVGPIVALSGLAMAAAGVKRRRSQP
jgi:hypothetical protein